jgi:hypothetical protein
MVRKLLCFLQRSLCEHIHDAHAFSIRSGNALARVPVMAEMSTVRHCVAGHCALNASNTTSSDLTSSMMI